MSFVERSAVAPLTHSIDPQVWSLEGDRPWIPLSGSGCLDVDLDLIGCRVGPERHASVGHGGMDGVATVVDDVGVLIDLAFGGSHAEPASASALSGSVANGSRSTPLRALRRSTTVVSTLPVNGLRRCGGRPACNHSGFAEHAEPVEHDPDDACDGPDTDKRKATRSPERILSMNSPITGRRRGRRSHRRCRR